MADEEEDELSEADLLMEIARLHAALIYIVKVADLPPEQRLAIARLLWPPEGGPSALRLD